MRFIHTSDWHIGRRFHHASLLDEQAYALQQLIQAVEQHNVDAVFIAGDIYDRAIPPTDAIRLVDETLHTLTQKLGVAVVMISGNHDSPERLHFASRQLTQSGLYIAGRLQTPISAYELYDEHGVVMVYALPYYDPALVRDRFREDNIQTYDQACHFLHQHILEQHEKAHTGKRKVIISHCFVTGGNSSDSERILSVGGADQVSANHFKAFDYAALGHLHTPQSCQSPHIRYSGSLYPYSFSEVQQTKSLTLVDLNATGQCHIKHIPLAQKRQVRIIEGQLEDVITQAHSDPHHEDYLLVRLTDTVAHLHVMQKLQTAYPNVLSIERIGLPQAQTTSFSPTNTLTCNELSVVQDFYKHIRDEQLSPEQQTIITQVLDNLESD